MMIGPDPWDVAHHAQNPNASTFEPPWLFKSLQTVGSLTFDSLSKISRSSGSWINNISPVKLGVRTKYDGGFRTRKKVRTPDEQGEAEQTAFASALSSGKKAAVLEFYSPKCRLCNTLLNFVLEVVGRNWQMQRMRTVSVRYSALVLASFLLM